MKFLENILSNQGTDDHCAEFITHDGLSPLLGLLNLPNMPLEFPLLPACQSVAAVCKSIVVSSLLGYLGCLCLYVTFRLMGSFVFARHVITELWNLMRKSRILGSVAFKSCYIGYVCFAGLSTGQQSLQRRFDPAEPPTGSVIASLPSIVYERLCFTAWIGIERAAGTSDAQKIPDTFAACNVSCTCLY